MVPDNTKDMVDTSNDTIYTLLVNLNNSFLRNGLALLLRPVERQAMQIGDAFDCIWGVRPNRHMGLGKKFTFVIYMYFVAYC